MLTQVQTQARTPDIAQRIGNRIGTRLPGLLCLLGLLAGTATAQDDRLQDPLADKASDPTRIERKEPGFWHRPNQTTPGAQLEFADQCLEDGRTGKARRGYNDLVHQWPDAPEAATAQLALARLLEAGRDFSRAFEEYQYLIENYMGRFPFDEVIERQIRMAQEVRQERHMTFLSFVGLPGFTRPLNAIPLYETILRNAPNSASAPEIRFNLGLLYEEDEDFDAAERAFDHIRLKHPASAFASEAAFRRGVCLHEIANEHPRDETRCRSAISALVSFTRDQPNHPRVPDAETRIDALKQTLVGMYHERAAFYDHIARRPQSALIAYSDFLSRFPRAPQAAEVNERIQALRAQTEKKHGAD